MKYYLLPEDGQFYKANLHCHSTFSDGMMTPAQIKKAYMDEGYSIVAITDHEIFIPHPELTDDNFVTIHGFEWGIDEDVADVKFRKVCHICCLALDPDIRWQPLWHRSKYQQDNNLLHMHEVQFDESQTDFVREYTPECISHMMKTARDQNFYVVYNHPCYSLERWNQYMNYHGMHALEIYNHSGVVHSYWDYCPLVYDDMLLGGERIACVAADDNHNHDTEFFADSFGGFVMIKAPKLDYRTIGQALLHGNYYASTGPEIHELWYDDSDATIHVRCSDAIQISCLCGVRQRRTVRAAELGKETINEAVFYVCENDPFIRINVLDAQRHTADTRAYFLDELTMTDR